MIREGKKRTAALGKIGPLDRSTASAVVFGRKNGSLLASCSCGLRRRI
jgi:hypothetical protein